MGQHEETRKIKNRNKFCNQQNYTTRAVVFDARPKRQKTRQNEVQAAIREYSYKD